MADERPTETSETNRHDLVLGALDQAARPARELERLCGGLSQLLWAGRQEEAMDQLWLLLSGLGAIAQAVYLTTLQQEEIRPLLVNWTSELQSISQGVFA
ncbi:MAG TPA: hypothetical protein P5568_02655 [Acidobacteriota bacterium]|nr:hypothetical protein [Acidobacteriota bacterium]